MLKIRLLRIGKKNQPSFKIVVVNSRRSSSSGRFVEEVGFVDRIRKIVKLEKEKVRKWLQRGAHPSSSVFNLLVQEKVIEERKIPLHKKPKKEKTEGSQSSSS